MARPSDRLASVRILVVLPTYQEAANIADVLRAVRTFTPEADILVVDDSSPDGTAHVAKTVGAGLGRVDVRIRPAKAGLGPAYTEGFREAALRGYEVVAVMDSDLSHDAAVLPELLAEVEAGADLAIGSRYVPGGSVADWAWHRRLLSNLGNRYTTWALGLAVGDATSGFRAYAVDAWDRIDRSPMTADGYAFNIEAAYRVARLGGTIAEVPICFVDRRRGTSKMSTTILIEAFLLVTWWAVRDRFAGLLRWVGPH